MKKLLVILAIIFGIAFLFFGSVILPNSKPQDAKTQEVSASPYVPQTYTNAQNKYSLSLFSPGLRWEVTESGGEAKFSRPDNVTLRLKILPLPGAEGTKYLDNRKKLTTEGATVDRRIPVSGTGWKGELIQVTPSDPIAGTKVRNQVDVYLQHGMTVSEWALYDEGFESMNETELSAFIEKTLPSFKI